MLEQISIADTIVWKADPSAPVQEAMLDSGTSLIIAPSNLVSTELATKFAINSDCSGLDAMPSMTFHLRTVDGGVLPYELHPHDYVLNRAGSCLTGIAVQSSFGTQGTVILGDVFIRKYMTVFNVGGGGQLGFALANQQTNDQKAKNP